MMIWFYQLGRCDIGHRKKIRISLRRPIHIINPIDKTTLSCNVPHRRSTTVSLETYPLKDIKHYYISQLVRAL